MHQMEKAELKKKKLADELRGHLGKSCQELDVAAVLGEMVVPSFFRKKAEEHFNLLSVQTDCLMLTA